MIDKQKIRQILDDNSNDSGDNCREFTRAEIDKTIEDIYNLVSVPAETLVMPKIAEIDFGINELENIKDYLDDNDIYFVNQRIAELEKKKSNFTV